MENKPILVLQAPVFTRSGYGSHSKDLLRSLYDLDKYDVKIVPTRWGNTPQNQIDPASEFGKRVFSSIIGFHSTSAVSISYCSSERVQCGSAKKLG
jgi:hypothetical protein